MKGLPLGGQSILGLVTCARFSKLLERLLQVPVNIFLQQQVLA